MGTLAGKLWNACGGRAVTPWSRSSIILPRTLLAYGCGPQLLQEMPSRNHYDPWREPCILVLEQVDNLMERHTCQKDYLPRAPPPSPTRICPSTGANLGEACPSSSCALCLVDQRIETHQARLVPTQRRQTPSLYPSAPLSDKVFGETLVCHDEQMHKMNPLHQVSSASDDDDDNGRTMTNSSCHSSEGGGTLTLGNDPASDRDVDHHSTAVVAHYQRKVSESQEPETQPSFQSRSPSFGLLNSRNGEAIISAPCRFRVPSNMDYALGPRPVFTCKHVSSPTPMSSSAITDMAILPLQYKQSKVKSWPGPCSQLPEPDTVIIPEAVPGLNSRICDSGYVYCGACNVRYGGGTPSCGECLSRNETRSLNKRGTSLRPSAELARGDIDEEQGAIMEEVHSHFSDDSSDEDIDSEKALSNVRLFNSLGKLNQRSRTRLSWSNLFSKP